ncbi:MAG TPA: ABC transporter ATP-binding protein [Thermofilum sp.]|nr:ABC transporter ATP-binding protein [Thermofilum sp.]
MKLLGVEDLNAGYGKLQILYGITFSLENKEILAIVGPNGSGKSTLLKSIFGLTTVYSGKVIFKGEEITNKPPHEKARIGLAYLPQIGNTFEKLTVIENLKMACYTLEEHEVKERIEEVLAIFPHIKPYLKRRVWSLSGGERQMVAMAMALTRRPEIIMMDEPSAALAPKIASQIFEKIVEIRDSLGKGVVLVEQNAKKALEVCDKALLLVAGQQAFLGSPEELLADPELAQTYLGVK